jgi:hypothetical protein
MRWVILVIACAEGLEVVGPGLVDEDVAVGQVEDAFSGLGLPQSPDDLEGGVGLAGAGGHDQQEALLPVCDGLDDAVDGVELVVAGRLVAAVEVVVLLDDRRASGVSNSLPLAVALPELGFWRGKSARLSSRSTLSPRPVRSCSRKPLPLLE